MLSKTLARFPNGIDSILRVYDGAGNPADYYGTPAESDDNFENQDAYLLDLPLPADGTYYVEVDTFTSADVPDVDVGQYELFLYTARPVAPPTRRASAGTSW